MCAVVVWSLAFKKSSSSFEERNEGRKKKVFLREKEPSSSRGCVYVLEAAEYRAAAAASTNFGPLIVELWRKVEKRKFEKSFLLFLEAVVAALQNYMAQPPPQSRCQAMALAAAASEVTTYIYYV